MWYRDLARHELAVGRRARELVGDRGYGTAAANQACEERGVTATLAMRSFSNAHGGLQRDQFTFVRRRHLICPTGQELRLAAEPPFPNQHLPAFSRDVPGLSPSRSALRDGLSAPCRGAGTVTSGRVGRRTFNPDTRGRCSGAARW